MDHALSYAAKGHSLGMQERVALLEGKTVFESSPDRGTRSCATIPMKSSFSNDDLTNRSTSSKDGL